MLTENQIGTTIVDCALKVHQALGPGLLESTYQACMEYELRIAGLSAVKQYPMPVIYKGVQLDVGYRIDLFVNGKVMIEVKSVDALHDVHMAQILTYLRLADVRLGYIINFNSVLIKTGIRRVVNRL